MCVCVERELCVLQCTSHIYNTKYFASIPYSSQFFADADDVDTWMLDTLRLVSSEDVGHDQASVESLLKKHQVSTMTP